MGHTPYGYRIENGRALIDEEKAEQIRKLCRNYLSGMALSKAAKEAGIETYHGTAKRMMQNRHYLGDDYYPTIIDADTFEKVEEERLRRAKKLGRLNKKPKEKALTVPTRFHMLSVTEHYDSPKAQAEYLYSQIESEVI